MLAALANIYTALLAALKALTAFLNVAPLFLAWKVTSECEYLTDEILKYENSGTPADIAMADQLRIKLAYRRKLHATLLTANAGTGSGSTSQNTTGDVHSTKP